MARWRRSWFSRIRYAVEDALAQVGRILVLPLTLLGRWRRRLTRTVGGARHSVGRIRWSRFFLAYLRFPFVQTVSLLRWMRFAFFSWWPRANYWHLLQGLPAVLVAGVLVFPLIGYGSVQTAGDYEEAGREAFADKKYELAEIYFKALTQLDPQNASYRYRLAITLEQKGDVQQASALMASLASPHQTGYPDAHLWQAWRLMVNPSRPDAAAIAEAHLLRSLQAKGPSAQAHNMLGQLYFQQGRLKDALEHFNDALPKMPELSSLVAKIYVRTGDANKAREVAQKGIAHFHEKLQANLDDHESRLQLAELYTFLENFGEAIGLLETGAKLSSDPRYKTALGRVYLTAADLQRQQKQVDANLQQQLLVNAFRNDPKSMGLLRRLLMGTYAGGDEARLVRNIIGECRNRGTSPALVEMLGAIDARQQGLNQTASANIRQAFAQDPAIGRTMGELARLMFDTSPSYAKQSREIVDLGLSLRPDDPELLHASGFLKLRSGQFIDSMMDLEKAAKSPDKAHDRALNAALAEVYGRLGMQEKSQERIKAIFAQPLEYPKSSESADR